MSLRGSAAPSFISLRSTPHRPDPGGVCRQSLSGAAAMESVGRFWPRCGISSRVCLGLWH